MTQTIRVLVAEDEAIVAHDIASTLEKRGFEVVGRVARGEDAVRLAREKRPDVILMDIRLRGELDGIDAAARIRERVDSSIVFLTAYKDESTFLRAASTQPDGYVLKPFAEDDLDIALQLAYHRRRAEQARRKVEQDEAFMAGQAREVEHLRRVNQFKTDFINQLAHEIRTPLTPLRLDLEVLRAAVPKHDTAAINKALATMSRSLDRLGRLVDGVLASSQLQAEKLALNEDTTDVAPLVSRCVESFRSQADEEGIALEVRSVGPATVLADAERIDQVVSNLLSNALKFTPRGGQVTVECSLRGDAARVTVSDTGIGFGPRDRDRLFGPFSRLSADPRLDRPGAGLGLYLSAEIIRLHGGTFWADSQGPGKGATFGFTLPRTREQVPARPAEPTGAVKPRRATTGAGRRPGRSGTTPRRTVS